MMICLFQRANLKQLLVSLEKNISVLDGPFIKLDYLDKYTIY